MGVFLAPRSIYMNPTNMHAAPVVQATTAGARVVLLGGGVVASVPRVLPIPQRTSATSCRGRGGLEDKPTTEITNPEGQ